MSKILSIVYHSGYGHTAKVAEAVVEGMKQQSGVTVNLFNAEELTDADWTTLDHSHAIVFGSPTYMGGVSAKFKAFAELTAKRWGNLVWKDKIAAGFSNSASYSGDKLASLQYMHLLAMQHGMIWVGQAEPAPQFSGTEAATHDQINRLGVWVGLATQANHKAGPDIAPPAGDLESARRFGARIAAITARLQ